jgi:hypothetical protein
VKAKNFESINVRTREALRAEGYDDIARLVGRWQGGLEARPGFSLCKLRLEFARSESQAITKLNP